MIKKIDHIAVAVDNLDEAIAMYRDVLGLEFHGVEEVAGQKVKVAFFKVGEMHIELTAPTSEDSPAAKFIAKRGAGIHHIAFEVDDISAQAADFESKGVRMIDREPKIGAGGAKIVFAHPKSFAGVLFELKEPRQAEESE
ncbi:MAG: methylmalonyl-CoA epimerase [Candidatus Aminicenantes bacterium]|nr:methylmalonyl-CoA epimerase [Candidatus Aminicenantes bacterium]